MKKTSIVALILVLFASTLLPLGAAEKKISGKAQKLMNEAFAAVKAKKAEEAVSLFQKVIELEPEYGIPYFNIGVIYWQLGKPEEAVNYFEGAVKHQPDYANAQKALHQSLYDLGIKASAAKEFDKSNGFLSRLLAQPGVEATTMLNAGYTLGVNLYYQKKFQESAEAFDKCLGRGNLEQDNFPIYANIVYFQGMNYHQLSQYGESNKHFLRFIDLFKSGERTSEFLPQAWFFAGTNQYLELEPKVAGLKDEELAARAKEIEPYFLKAIELKVPVENAYVMLGNLYAYEKSYEAAQRTYAELTALYPASPDIAKYKSFLEKLEAIIKQQKAAAAKKPAKK